MRPAEIQGVIPGFAMPGERAGGSFSVENGRQPGSDEAESGNALK